MFLTCFVCKRNIDGPLSQLLRHFRWEHLMRTSNKVKRNLICGQLNCDQNLSSFGSFSYHIKNCNSAQHNLGAVNEQRNVEQQQPQRVPNNMVEDFAMDVDENIDDENVEEVDPIEPLDQITKLTSKIWLDVRAQHNVHHVVIDYLTASLHLIIQIIKQGDVGHNMDIFSNALQKNNSQIKRFKLYKAHFGFIEPEELESLSAVTAPRMEISTAPSGFPIVRRVINTFHYIPLKKTLTVLFSNDNFREAYFSEKRSADEFMRSHRDGQAFQSHPLFSVDPHALRLQLFFDDVETSNPLGSKRGLHQLGNVYFQILNMPTSMNSRLSSIYALAICYTLDLSADDQQFVWLKVMEEIHELESDEGMALALPHNPRFRLRGTIASFCADTKGAHEVGGFLSPSANMFCRLCLTHRSEIIQNKTFDCLQLRTRENYDQAIADDEDPSETGLRKDSILNASRYFHFADNLILDAMHDVLEGVVPFIFNLVMYHFVVHRPDYNMNARLLNSRLKSFHYGPHDVTNKPTPSFKDENLRKKNNYKTCQKAIQNWTLIRLFPLMFGDVIPEGDPHFHLILLLLFIMDFLFSPYITESQTLELECLVTQLFEEFEALFPEISPINKFHHLLHYAYLIRANGPAVFWWCIRFEAFHNIAKRIAQVNFNYRNLPKTVANHIQTISCSKFQDRETFTTDQITLGPKQKLKDSLKNILEQTRTAFQNVEPVTWVVFNGWKFRKGTVILFNHSYLEESNLPVFAQIMHLFTKDETSYIAVSMLSSVLFDEHYHAFQVQFPVPEKFAVLKLNDVPLCHPMWLLEDFVNDLDSPKFVCPRHWC